MIVTPEDLFGKLVFHFCVVQDSVNEDEDWHCGVVVDRHGSRNFLIKYGERLDTLLSCKLFNDFSDNSVAAYNFICSTIKLKYNNAVIREDTWWDDEVIDLDTESEDKKNSNFFNLYKESADDFLDLAKLNDDYYFVEPLINDYLNG